MRLKYMGKKFKISFAGVIIISFCHYVLHAETMDTAKNIIIFDTYIGDSTIPEEEIDTSLKLLESRVQKIFLGLAGFDVRLMDYVLAYEDLMLFLNQVKIYTAGEQELASDVKVGEQIFSQQDFSQIIDSELVIIPLLTSLIREEVINEEMPSKYKVIVSITYTVIDIKNAVVLKNIVLESIGYDEDKDQALADALENIPLQLTYEVRSMDVFSLGAGIVEIIDPDVVIKLGKDAGVSVGDEYSILDSHTEDTAEQTENREKGLIIIHDIEEKVSIGKVIYADDPLTVGTTVKQISRLGLTVIPYVHVEIDFERFLFNGFSGLKFILTKGFFAIQPVLCFEFGLYPFERLEAELPLRAYGGLDFNIYLGRFQLAGMVAVGTEVVTALSADSRVEGFDFSSFGLAGIATISYLITRDLRLMLDLGYQAWFALNDNYMNYESLICGAGVGIKF
jgi:hypothetical protein